MGRGGKWGAAAHIRSSALPPSSHCCHVSVPAPIFARTRLVSPTLHLNACPPPLKMVSQDSFVFIRCFPLTRVFLYRGRSVGGKEWSRRILDAFCVVFSGEEVGCFGACVGVGQASHRGGNEWYDAWIFPLIYEAQGTVFTLRPSPLQRFICVYFFPHFFSCCVFYVLDLCSYECLRNVLLCS